MILIRSAKVVDGTGKPAYTADVLTQGSKIAAIGYFPGKKADEIIDGLGLYLTPGFIDAHSDLDHSLNIFDPNLNYANNYLNNGITTVIGGNCGSSLAPLLSGTLESVQKWSDINKVNVNWRWMSEFFSVLEKMKLGLNFGTLVGHSTIRRNILGEEFRDLTDRELIVFEKTVEKSLEEGAFGLSTGLEYAHSNKTSFPEIKALAQLVKKFNRIYATHLRNEKEGLVNSVKETIKISEETGVRTIISHFRPIVGFENQFQEALLLIDKTKSDLFFDVYLSDKSLVPIYTLLPLWMKSGGLSLMLSQLLNEHVYQRLIKELSKFKREEIIIASAPDNNFLVGKTIGEIAKNRGLTITEALLQLMISTRLKATVFYKNINLDLLRPLLSHPRLLIGSNTEKMLGGLIQNYFSWTNNNLENAVKKITSLPAEKFNIKNRGVIKEGNFADLVLLKFSETSKEIKINSVIINGELVMKNGISQNIAAGKVLRCE